MLPSFTRHAILCLRHMHVIRRHTVQAHNWDRSRVNKHVWAQTCFSVVGRESLHAMNGQASVPRCRHWPCVVGGDIPHCHGGGELGVIVVGVV